MGRAYSTSGRNKNCIQNLVEKRGGTKPLGRIMSRLGDNVRMGVREIGWKVVA